MFPNPIDLSPSNTCQTKMKEVHLLSRQQTINKSHLNWIMLKWTRTLSTTHCVFSFFLMCLNIQPLEQMECYYLWNIYYHDKWKKNDYCWRWLIIEKSNKNNSRLAYQFVWCVRSLSPTPLQFVGFRHKIGYGI